MTALACRAATTARRAVAALARLGAACRGLPASRRFQLAGVALIVAGIAGHLLTH